MKVDITTLKDIGLYDKEDNKGLISHLNYTKTNGGSIQFEYFFQNPIVDIQSIKEREKTISIFEQSIYFLDSLKISNGTLLVIDKFFESGTKPIPKNINTWNSLLYKWFNKADFSLVKYSVDHCTQFIIELYKWQEHFASHQQNNTISSMQKKIKDILDNEHLVFINQPDLLQNASYILTLGHYFQYSFKHRLQVLETLYYDIDALYSMAKAKIIHKFVFPDWTLEGPQIEFEDAFHPLVDNAIPNSIKLNNSKNFLFLTGANMAGKSTFIKTIGLGVYLAHIGIGVPAKKAKISFFDGLITNLNIADNILKGESYFYNEVQRIKKTVQQVKTSERYCVLIDELFKGTNIIDAMKCSTIVIEGLQKVQSSVFVLSTHLYEISSSIEHNKNIDFKYFETSIQETNLTFPYTLQEGVSQDRIGYLILEREGVVKMLEAN